MKRKSVIKTKKGISPVIATILLISIVVAMGLIVFLWFKDFLGDAITKGDENIELVCGKVYFDATYDGGTLYVSNDGNIPIYKIKLKQIYSAGDYEEGEVTSADWPEVGLNPGETFLTNIDLTGVEEAIVIPILLGQTTESKKIFECKESDGVNLGL